VTEHYPIRPEREAHIVAGTSMGGFAAFNYGIKHREAFGIVIGMSPLLNVRWQNKQGDYLAPFDPRDWGWCSEVGGFRHPVCRLLDAGKRMCMRDWLQPLYGPGDDAITAIAQENPIELVDRYQLRPGQLEMYVAYTADDEFNTGAQVESFLYLARWRGLCVGVGYQELGRHCIETAAHMLPGALAWLTPRIAPFSPLMPVACPTAAYAPCPESACAPCSASTSCPTGDCAQPKHRLLGPHPAPCPTCGDLSCHLPPLFLPDRVPEEK
jgi:pimeloyl-ACP methyl ester carboxylesterase